MQVANFLQGNKMNLIKYDNQYEKNKLLIYLITRSDESGVRRYGSLEKSDSDIYNILSKQVSAYMNAILHIL